MDFILYAFMAAFAVGAGFFLGCGSYSGWRGALIPGLVTGLLISIPALRDSLYIESAIMVLFALVGSIVAGVVPDTNRLKRLCRSQSMLNLRAGSYRLGRKDPRK